MSEELFFASQCSLEEDLLDQAAGEGMAAGRAVFYQGSAKGAALVYSLHSGSGNMNELNSEQYIIYTIRDSKLREQFSPSLSEGVSTITYQDSTIYSNKGEELNLSDDLETFSVPVDNGFAVWNQIPKKEIWKSMMPYFQGYAIWIFCSLMIGIALAVYYSKKRYAVFQDLLSHNVRLEGERKELRAENYLYELLTEDVTEGAALWRECLDSGIRIDRAYKYIIVFSRTEENEELKSSLCSMNGDNLISTAYKIRLFGDLQVWLVCTEEKPALIRQRLSQFTAKGARFLVSSFVTDAGKLKDAYEAVMKTFRKEQSPDEEYPRIELEALKEAAALGDDARTKVLLKELGEIVKESSEVIAVLIGFETAQILELNVQEFYIMAREGRFSSQDVWRLFNQALSAWKPADRMAVPDNRQFRKKTIADVLAWLHEHYLDDNFTVKYMADYFDTSVSNLSHYFKKNMDITISQYVEQIKLDKAKELLTDSDIKISEIAQILRYSNSSAFITMFKKYEGMTPKEYRDAR